MYLCITKQSNIRIMELNIRNQYIQDIYKIVRDKNIDLHILKCNFEGWCLDEIKQLKYLLLS